MAKSLQRVQNNSGNMYQDCQFYMGQTEEYMKLMKEKKYEELQSKLQEGTNLIGTNHPLYPLYSVGIKEENGNPIFYSKIMSKEAVEEYPPKVRGHFRFSNGNSSLSINEMLKKSYNNQEALSVEIIDIEKFLGDFKDVFQDEVKDLKGKRAEIYPPEFPMAKPFSILVDGELVYDYIELRIERILDDGIWLISNREQQNSDFKIALRVDVSKKTTDFSLKNYASSNESNLRYDKFMKALANGEKLTIKSLKYQTSLFEGTINNFDYKSAFEDIDEEIEFLEAVVLIEKTYGKCICIDGEIKNEDYEKIMFIADMIKGKSREFTWDTVTFSVKFNDHIKEKILTMNSDPLVTDYRCDEEINVFGESFEIKNVNIILNNVIFSKLDKLKRLAEVLDEGDTIDIEIQPVEEKGTGVRKCVEYLEIEEKN